MGHAIALLLARAGLDIALIDSSEKQLEQARELMRSYPADAAADRQQANAIQARISTHTNFATHIESVQWVIETIVEEEAAKRDIFEKLAARLSPTTPVTSNTSYLDVFSLAPQSLQAQLFIAHFFNPPHIIPLVEIAKGPNTAPGITAGVTALLRQLSMTVVELHSFMPGLIVNRLQRAIGRELFNILDHAVADPEDIDRAVKASLGVRLPVLGVVARYDHGGLDMAIRALEAPPIGLANEERVPDVLRHLVNSGNLGVKTGRGFFDYSRQPLAETLRVRDEKLLKVRRLLEELGDI